MGIPAEDIGDISSSEESGSSQPNPDDASAFPGKPVDDGDDGEEESPKDARSTQFGLPAVDREDPDGQEDSEAQTPVPEPSDSQAGEAGRTGNWTGWNEQTDSGSGEDPSEESVLSAWGISEASEPSDDEQPPTEERETVQGTESAEGPPRDTHKTQMGMPRFDPDEMDPEDIERGKDPTQKFDEDSLAKVEEHVKKLNEENAEPDEPEDASPGAGVVNPASNSSKSKEGGRGGSDDTGNTLHGQIPGAEGPGSYSTSSGSYRAADVDRDQEGGGSDASGDSEEAAARQGRQTMRGLMGKDLSDGESSAEGQRRRREPTDEEPGLEDTAQGGPTAQPPDSDEVPGMEDTAQGGPTARPPDADDDEQEPVQQQPGQSGFGSDGPTGFKVDEPSEEIAIDGGVADNPFNPEASNTPGIQEDSPEESADRADEERQRETSSVSEILGDLDESEEAAEPQTDNVADAAAEATGESDEFGFFDSDDDSGFEMPSPDEIAVSVEEDDEDFESDSVVEPVDEAAAESVDEAEAPTADPVVEASDSEVPEDSTPSDQPPVDQPQEPVDQPQEPEPGADGMEEESEPAEAQPPPESDGPADSDGVSPDEAQADQEQAEPPADEEEQLADLSQTVFGLIAGVSMGGFLVVQSMTIGFMGHPFFLALAVGGAIGGLGSLLLPLLPLDGGIRSGSFVGIGLLVSALAVAATVSGQALAVAPLIALFGGIFALGAGLIPHALAMVGD